MSFGMDKTTENPHHKFQKLSLFFIIRTFSCPASFKYIFFIHWNMYKGSNMFIFDIQNI